MSEALKVERRTPGGRLNNRRLRRAGRVPAILYGHGQENVALSACADAVAAMVRHGSRVVDLEGDLSEKALIRELQWDTFGVSVLHLDLARISADERVTVTVSVAMRGTAPGLAEGGQIEHILHEVEVECLAISIPDRLFINVNGLHLDGEMTASQIDLPEGMTLISNPDDLVVHCVKPKEEGEEAAMAGAGEPEVIGRKKEEEGEAEE